MIAFTSRVSITWKIIFQQPENQFPRTGIRYLFNKLSTPSSKNFKKALNKKMLFPLGIKSVFPSRNEEFIKRYVSIRRKS